MRMPKGAFSSTAPPKGCDVWEMRLLERCGFIWEMRITKGSKVYGR